ncbi:H-NS family nucleoid-associated regulatory protein [Thalassospira profundimaris]|uniref:H-NS histone family protein n=1 Tax=Thalassospira profundimaris TaxID=502049 RepID=UPI000DED9866|nr:H-NS histone family protein [Thalassospira profundimaris]
MSTIDISKLSYKELRELMEQTEEEVENRKEQAIKDLRAEFNQKLNDAGFSIRELYPEVFKATAASSAPAKSKQSTPPKYRNPVNPEETWTGRGRVIGWVLKLAEEKGTTVDAIKNDPAYLNPEHPNYKAHVAELEK